MSKRGFQSAEHGKTYARDATWDWDISSKLKAQREIEDMLKRDVDSDWLEHEVEDAVQDVLAGRPTSSAPSANTPQS